MSNLCINHIIQNDLTIIIRSVGENTENLLTKLLKSYGIPQNNIFIVSLTPFFLALEESYKIGISNKLSWTLCLDADVLISKKGLESLISFALKQNNKVFEVQGYLYDKFFLCPRQVGNHLYRTKFLPLAIKSIPRKIGVLRPEAATIMKMKKSGFNWRALNETIGIHDFHQSYKDIYRKAFFFGLKHRKFKHYLLKRWKECAKKDLDYTVAIDGFEKGYSLQNMNFHFSSDANLPAISESIGSFFDQKKELNENIKIYIDNINEIMSFKCNEEVINSFIYSPNYFIYSYCFKHSKLRFALYLLKYFYKKFL